MTDMTGRLALALALLAAGVAGCGGDEPDKAPPKPELRVPGGDRGSADRDTTGDETATDETTPAVPDTTTPAVPGATTPTPTPTPTPQPVPDSPANDTPPPPGSAADRFEDFCTQNPGAC